HAAVRHPLEDIQVALAVHSKRMRRGELVFEAGLEFLLLLATAVAEAGDAIVVLVDDRDEAAEGGDEEMTLSLVGAAAVPHEGTGDRALVVEVEVEDFVAAIRTIGDVHLGCGLERIHPHAVARVESTMRGILAFGRLGSIGSFLCAAADGLEVLEVLVKA